ncbi:hypothetical protein V6N13_092183 [Hibiscus sabdariffa]
MASLVCFITLFLSYVSIGVGFDFVSTLVVGSVMSIAVSSLEMEATLSKDTSKRCKWLGDMSSLEHLDLSTNYLTGDIPQSLGKLTCLRQVNISYNSIEKFDASVKALLQH